MIYLIANTKGGVGKSNIASHLAGYLAGFGRTLLVDADPQASSASWYTWRRETAAEEGSDLPMPVTIILKKELVFHEIRRMAPEYDNTVIDAGGRDSVEMRYALTVADRVIIPISNSGFDSAAWGDMENVLNMALPNNPNLQRRVAMSRIHRQRKAPNDLEKFVRGKGFDLMGTIIHERAPYVSAIESGKTVMEAYPNTTASIEMKNFCKEATAPWPSKTNP